MTASTAYMLEKKEGIHPKTNIGGQNMKKVIVCNETTEHSDYRFGVISLETGKPIEIIDLDCYGDSFETSYFIDELKRNNLYSEYMEKPSDVVGGKCPVDIEDWGWFGWIVSKVVLEGIRANRDYEILYTYGMEIGDGYSYMFKNVED